MPERQPRAEGCRLVLLAGTTEHVDAPNTLWHLADLKPSQNKELSRNLDRACDGSKKEVGVAFLLVLALDELPVVAYLTLRCFH